jgi:8-oxo-dGTP pyrophosphatase MutT (NUDIX family)
MSFTELKAKTEKQITNWAKNPHPSAPINVNLVTNSDDLPSTDKQGNSLRYSCNAIIIRNDFHVLFIKRAFFAGDRWSGNIAFPGGKSESGETLRQTLDREVMEELAIDLGNEMHLKCIAILPPVKIGYSLRKKIVLYTFVFFQISDSKDFWKIKANEEVAAYLWVPLGYFLHNDILMQRSLDSLVHNSSICRNLFLKAVFAPVIPLLEAADQVFVFSDKVSAKDANSFLLWGISLNQFSIFFRMLQLDSIYKSLNSGFYAFAYRIFRKIYSSVEYLKSSIRFTKEKTQ